MEAVTIKIDNIDDDQKIAGRRKILTTCLCCTLSEIWRTSQDDSQYLYAQEISKII